MTRQEALVMLEIQNAYDVGACQRVLDDLDIDPAGNAGTTAERMRAQRPRCETPGLERGEVEEVDARHALAGLREDAREAQLFEDRARHQPAHQRVHVEHPGPPDPAHPREEVVHPRIEGDQRKHQQPEAGARERHGEAREARDPLAHLRAAARQERREASQLDLGLALLASTLVAIGLMVSALTANQVVAAVVTIGICFTLWMIDSLAGMMPDGLERVLISLSLLARFTPFATGAIYTSDFGFFLTSTLLALFLAMRALARR